MGLKRQPTELKAKRGLIFGLEFGIGSFSESFHWMKKRYENKYWLFEMLRLLLD